MGKLTLTASQGSELASRDFFVSYTGADQGWAEWIAWQLEEAGHTCVLQAWDFTSGSRFVHEMHRAAQVAERTIAVLSNAYLESSFAEAEWQEAWRADPGGEQRKLLVFRVENCKRPGLLGQLVSDDLFGVDEMTARSRLLAAIRQGRRKPDLPPGFPAHDIPMNAKPFPGQLVEATLDEAVRAGGPMTADNPFGVAFAFWHAVLHDDYSDLDQLVTPESRGRWDLADIARRTADSGITTAVMKPCFDVAYVRLASGVGEGPPALQVVGGLVPLEARIISLVYRPELGGWRVHGFGYPLDPANLPRTWTT
ncbi:toll/interleukin-1 receptor domain-containing protein [Amycolatopsis thermoflava]|uniref:toll/interleukin-1 receptor domain-containing protein n=1 Tax=Amycolatopsis thermoflava TaxID=84480 RepID=UPI0036552D45